MQMLYVGDAIASLSEIGEEVRALAPDYPWWREVASVEDAIEWFTALRHDPSFRTSQNGLDQLDHRARLPDWKHAVDILIGILENPYGTRKCASK